MATTEQPNRGRTALITGASSGIGLELAKLFAHDGFNLTLVARNEQKLSEIASKLRSKHSIEVKTIAKDLSMASSPDELFQEVSAGGTHVDVLVNNAGFTVYGPFAENKLADEAQMMQVNMVTLTHLTKLFLPAMLEKGWGRILNVASVAAFQPGPLMAIYYASKSYVLSFSEAIANELKGTGVTVTVLCPGATATNFWERGKVEGSRLMSSSITMSAASVAKSGYRALMKGQTTVIPGFTNRLFVQSVRFVPRKLMPGIVRRVQERI